MASTNRERGPCDNCRERHIKCSRGDPCENCTKYEQRCTRARAFRFKKTPRFKSNLSFSADQPWLNSKTDSLSYVDMTKKVRRKHAAISTHEPISEDLESGQERLNRPENGESLVGDNTMGADPQEPTEAPPALSTASSPSSQRPPAYSSSFEIPQVPSYNPGGMENNLFNVLSPPSASWRSSQLGAIVSPRIGYDAARDRWRTTPGDFASPLAINHSAHTSSVAAATNRSNQSTALSGVPETMTDVSYLGLQEACLLRHFVEELAPWFDTCDRDRHFALVVPQRAMFCPTLLYAVYTASARHLTRLKSKRNAQNVVECYGVSLPDLNEDVAIHYHNICINYLYELSNDLDQSYHEDSLAIATILRFYEQIDTPLTGCDSQIYLNLIRAVIDTQQEPSFYAIWKIHGPPRDLDLYASPAISLRHYACMLALQQEVWSILLSQRPCRLPLCPNNDYSTASLTPTDDFIWASRILVWTADVLKFCFGDENSNTINMSMKTRIEHWEALKQFESSWEVLRPTSFKPAYYAPPDPARGKMFPEFWQMNDCQILALQHVELAHIMLAVHSPKLPRLGLGAEAAQRAIRVQTRESCLKICGLGSSKKGIPAAMVTAAIGISICGECLRDPQEQDAVVRLMQDLEIEHAWPTKAVVEALREAWDNA